ncbi:MAG: FkbM family methyltransferase [Spirosomataceae bacterium]
MKKVIKQLAKAILGENTILIAKTWFRSEEEKRLIQKRRTFYLQFLTAKGDRYFDVGANYGNRIEPIVDDGFTIIAIEPQSSCINYLKRRFNNKILIVPKGLGAVEGRQTLYISDVNTISSFSKDWIRATQESGRFSQYNWEQEQAVEMTTLDKLIELYGKPQFIKIDVEGFELEVLQGLSQPVPVLSFEYTIPERKQAILECIDRIVELAKGQPVTFNYSISESMEWALEAWLSPQEMKQEVDNERFVVSEFGDIYAKTIVNS